MITWAGLNEHPGQYSLDELMALICQLAGALSGCEGYTSKTPDDIIARYAE